MQTPETANRLIAQNLEPFAPMTQPQWAAYMRDEFAKWRQVARDGKITSQ